MQLLWWQRRAAHRGSRLPHLSRVPRPGTKAAL